MVLPPCRCPSASWRSRVLPACRSAGHPKCRARAFRAPLPGGGSGRRPHPFAGFRRAPLDKAPRTMVRYRQSDGERVGRERRCFMGFMMAVMAAIAVMAMARMTLMTVFTRTTKGQPTPTNSRHFHTNSRQIHTECRAHRRSSGQERPLLPCSTAPSRA